MPPPYYIDWAITHRCNLRCDHCRGMRGKELPTERALVLFKEIADLKPGWVIIEGGEPLMRKDIFSLLRYARELGLKIFIITNGTLLTRNAVEWCAGLGIDVMISIDSPDPATFERIRRGASFKSVVKAASLCAEAKALNAINFTLSKQNLEQIPAIFRLARNVRVKRLNILGLKPCERYSKQLLSPPEYRKAIEDSCRSSDDTGVEFFFDEPFFNVAVREWGCGYKTTDNGSSITIREESGCILGKYLFITSGGDVWPCSFSPLAMGNLHREGLGSVWTKMGRSEKLKSLMSSRDRKGKCGACIYVEECRGCRARAFRLTRDWLAEDSACPVLQ